MTDMTSATLYSTARTHETRGGLKVITVSRPYLHEGAASLVVRAGSIEDPPGQRGLAHMAEHMMFGGAGDLSREEFQRQASRAGARINASTSACLTQYAVDSHAETLAQVLAMLASAFRAPRMEGFETERRVLIEEARGAWHHGAPCGIGAAIRGAMFEGAAASNVVAGHPADLAEIEEQDVRAYMARWHVLTNMHLTVAGPQGHEELYRMAASAFSSELPPQALPARQEVSLRASMSRPMFVHAVSDGERPTVTATWVGRVGQTQAIDALDGYAMELVGMGTNSRLFDRVRNMLGLSYDPSGSCAVLGGYRIFTMGADTTQAKVADLTRAIRAVVDEAVLNGPSDAEIEDTRMAARAYIFSHDDSIGGLAAIHSMTYELFGHVLDFDAAAARIAETTRDEVHRAIRRVLVDAPLLVVAGAMPEEVDIARVWYEAGA